MNNSAVAVFAKNPVAGKVKTRLARTVGEQKALGIYTFMLKNILDETEKSEADKYIFYDEDPISPFFGQYKQQYDFVVQKGDDLGRRMINCFDRLFLTYSQIIIIGSDIPGINKDILQIAFEGLKEHKISVGPTADGGYYLIGFSKEAFKHDFFKNIKWSTYEVFEKTINKIKKVWYNPLVLPMLHDVDMEADLKYLRGFYE